METAFRSEERFNQEDFRRWLDSRPASDVNHYELLNGRIVMTPPAGWPHGKHEVTLVVRLDAFVRSRGLGVVQGSSAGYDLPSGDTVEPDVSYISAQRLAAGPEPVEGQFLRIVPNLVVEILSRSTRRRDLGEKLAIYERSGVEEYWVVDHRARSVTVFTRTGERFDRGRVFTSGRFASRVLPGLEIALEEIFPA